MPEVIPARLWSTEGVVWFQQVDQGQNCLSWALAVIRSQLRSRSDPVTRLQLQICFGPATYCTCQKIALWRFFYTCYKALKWMNDSIDFLWLHRLAVAAACFTLPLWTAAFVAHMAVLGLPWNACGDILVVWGGYSRGNLTYHVD